MLGSSSILFYMMANRTAHFHSSYLDIVELVAGNRRNNCLNHMANMLLVSIRLNYQLHMMDMTEKGHIKRYFLEKREHHFVDLKTDFFLISDIIDDVLPC